MHQIYAVFFENGNIQGFYADSIHDNIPETAIPITEEEWQEYSRNFNRYKRDGDTIREKTAEEIEAERAARPKPPPSRVDILEAENADLWYEIMLKDAKIAQHDSDIADLYYEMMMGGATP